MKISKITMSAAAAVLALTLISRAGDTPTANPFLAVLSTITQAELPAKAADLVAQADAKHQQQTTIDVVKAAVGLNPAAAAVIIGSIAQTTPAMAAIAAGTAAGLVPNQAAAIARAAAVAAPQQAGKIVEAICRVVPGAGKEILAGVSAAIPALKGPIDKVLLAGNGGVASVYAVLTQVESMQPSVSSGVGVQPMMVAPVIKPPSVPPPANPVNLNPGSGTPVPPGGRNYSTIEGTP